MRSSYFIGILVLLSQTAVSQANLTGKITDQDHQPLTGGTIYLPDLDKGTISDTAGNYRLSNLPDGTIRVQFSYVGYSNYIETVELKGEPLILNVSLRQTAVEGEEIVISGGYSTTQHANAVKIDILKLNPLTTISTPNFMEVLLQVPGVDMISKGSGVSKPVIRGLSMNDILVLNNGVRYENYQYSSHHPLGIDEFGIENIEIIKGPASLLYGSDAIGGVINFIKERPAPIGTFSGDYNMQLFSNTLGVINNLGLKGASKKVFGGIRVGQKSNADFLQGGGVFVPNSRFNEWSVKANAGSSNKLGSYKIYYDYSNQNLGLVEDEAIDAIPVRGRNNSIWYQEFNTHLVSSRNKLYLGQYKLDLNSAYQNTGMIHFGDVDLIEIQMNLSTWTYEAKLHFPSGDHSEYIVGFQGFNQTNTNQFDRETILLPDAVTKNNAAFGLIQHTFFSKLQVQAGLRYDIKSILSEAIGQPEAVGYRISLDKSYGSFSGSAGATFHATEAILFRANFSSAYRTPNLAELSSNGQHELRYEIGDQDLVPENAYEADLSMHIHKDNLSFDIAGFFNKINHYIFIAPTGDTTSTGIGIYRYQQANSDLFGGEAGLHLHPKVLEWLHFITTFSSVIGKQENGDYLPFIPANKLRFEFQAEKENLLFFKTSFASIHLSTAFEQNNAAPDETPTDGYTLVDLSVGSVIDVRNQPVTFRLGFNNLFDKKYVDHLSTLKEVDQYNPGRNITLSLKIPFDFSK